MKMKIRNLKCSICKKDIIVGQKAVEVILDDGTRMIVHTASNDRCLWLLKKEHEDG